MKVSLNTKVACNCGGDIHHSILQKYIDKGSNDVMGPGYRSYGYYEYNHVYNCEKCGIVYVPTPSNSLEEGSGERTKYAKYVFENYELVEVKKHYFSLILYRVEEDGDFTYEAFEEAVHFLPGSYVFAKRESKSNPTHTRDIESGLYNSLYITPATKDEPPCPVRWSPKKYYSRKLTQEEKKKERLSLVKQKKRFTEEEYKREYRKIGTRVKMDLMDNDPLPAGSVEGIQILLLSDRREYVLPRSYFQ